MKRLCVVAGAAAVLAVSGYAGAAKAFDIPVTFNSNGMYFVRISASGPTDSDSCQIAFSNKDSGCTLILKNGRHLVTAVRSDNGPKWQTVRQVVKWWITVPNDTGGVDVDIPSHEVEFTFPFPGPQVYGISSALNTAFGLETSPSNFNLPSPITSLTGSAGTKIVRMMDGCYTLVYTWPNNQSGSGITNLVIGDIPLCVGGDVGDVLAVTVPPKP
jgi:hypothetical protein